MFTFTKRFKELAFFKDWPIRRKVVLLLIVASTFPLAIAALVEFQYERRLILKDGTDLLTARGDQVVGELDNFHRSYQRTAGRLARLPPILRFVHSSSQDQEKQALQVRAILNVYQTSDQAFRGVAILDPTGSVLLSTEKSLMGRNLSFYAHVRDALHGSIVISDLYVSMPEAGSIPTVDYLVPIRGPDAKVVGVVALWVKATALWDILQAWNEKAGKQSFSVLFDQFGVRIAHSYNKNIVFHPGGTLEPAVIVRMVEEKRFGEKTRGLLEEPWVFPKQFDMARSPSAPARDIFWGFAPVNQTWNYGVPRRLETVPWTLFYMIPQKSLDIPIAGLTKRMIFLSLLIITLAFGAGMFFAGRIISPIKNLSKAVQTMSQGQLNARVAVEADDELGRLGMTFNAMAERLEAMIEAEKKANKELEAFSYSVSHDLRAPLRHIDGFIDLLSRKLPSQVDDECREYLSTISDSAKRMGSLIDELLAFSKMGRTEMRKSKVHLSAVIKEILQMLAGEFEKRTIEWKIADLPVMECDPAMMRLVFSNLIGNALKFTRDRDKAFIEIGTRNGKSDQVVFFVRDNGAGFDMQYADKLFGVFQRLHRDDEFEGTGIGLANVRRIIYRHGGETWAEGEVDKGAVFYFSLPFKQKPPNTPQAGSLMI